MMFQISGEKFAKGDCRGTGHYGFQLFAWLTNFDWSSEMVGWKLAQRRHLAPNEELKT